MNANGAPHTDIGSLVVAIENDAVSLEQDADALSEAIQNAAIAEAAYDEAFEKELLKIYHLHRDKRMPAEDVRKALAHEQVESGIYGAHLMAKANVAALTKRMAGRQAAVSARQSILRFQNGAG